jgi:2-polyprenyl-3-methyl-5-hydroxy-6-metoxy-1,4-benzoquinol methylase
MENYVDTYSDPSEYEVGRDSFDRAILENIDLPVGATLLEIGCGNGRFLKLLGPKYPGILLSGLDSSYTGIETCQSLLTGDFICADILNYSTHTKYDIVMCFNTLEHFQSPSDVLRKIKELTCRDGQIILTVPNKATDRCADHLHFWDVKSFTALCSEFFSVDECYLIDNDQNIILKAWNISATI